MANSEPDEITDVTLAELRAKLEDAYDLLDRDQRRQLLANLAKLAQQRRSVVMPHRPLASNQGSYRLGICDPEVIFTPEELRQLREDQAVMARTWHAIDPTTANRLIGSII